MPLKLLVSDEPGRMIRSVDDTPGFLILGVHGANCRLFVTPTLDPKKLSEVAKQGGGTFSLPHGLQETAVDVRDVAAAIDDIATVKRIVELIGSNLDDLLGEAMSTFDWPCAHGLIDFAQEFVEAINGRAEALGGRIRPRPAGGDQ